MTVKFFVLFVFIILPLCVFVNTTPISNPGHLKIRLKRVHTSKIDPGLLSLLKRDPQGKEYLNNVNDIRYTGSIIIGGQNLTIMIDSGSSDLWVPSVFCSTPACTSGTRYDPAKSTTYQTLPAPNNFTLNFGDGAQVDGFKATETVTIGGLSVTQQTFGVLTTFTSNQYRGGGIMGINFRQSTRFNAPGVIQTMKTQKVINKALVGFHFSAPKVNANDVSYITFGDVPNEYANSISYNKVVENRSWIISMSDVQVDGNSLGIKSNVLIDTGSTLNYGLSSQVNTLHQKISGSNFSNDLWWIPCNTKSVVSVVFNGVPYEINPLQLITIKNNSTGLCRSGIQIQPNTNASFWTLGDVFLSNVFTAFDFDNLRIGFATSPNGTGAPGTSPGSGNDNPNNVKKSDANKQG
ncbi:443_t:CDS:2 [Racocetra fulgida]|uniref:443_t:CDS:1 n=1 Tax=Racocetra fulgida TaxID=60492 RepID=A0A9N8Z6Y5_9GLOM|nr:443_t:CDS:2 [Racocetra fulgida]